VFIIPEVEFLVLQTGFGGYRCIVFTCILHLLCQRRK